MTSDRFRDRNAPAAAATDRRTRPADLRRRAPRHTGMLTAVRALDTRLSGYDRAAVAAWISEQYASTYGSVLLGLVAQCHLGPPYVDHQLDLLGQIIEHFSAADPMPAPFDSARMLARSGAYAFVEVHSDGTLVPVADDGTIV